MDTMKNTHAYTLLDKSVVVCLFVVCFVRLKPTPNTIQFNTIRVWSSLYRVFWVIIFGSNCTMVIQWQPDGMEANQNLVLILFEVPSPRYQNCTCEKEKCSFHHKQWIPNHTNLETDIQKMRYKYPPKNGVTPKEIPAKKWGDTKLPSEVVQCS